MTCTPVTPENVIVLSPGLSVGKFAVTLLFLFVVPRYASCRSQSMYICPELPLIVIVVPLIVIDPFPEHTINGKASYIVGLCNTMPDVQEI